MAIIRNISIAFNANTSAFTAGVYKATGALNMMRKASEVTRTAVAGVAGGLIGGFGLVAGAIAIKRFFVGGISGAAELNETVSKTEVILGAAAPKIIAMADEMATKYGQVKKEVLDAASSFGGMGKNVGKLSGGKLEEFTKDMTQTAVDLVSLQSMPFDIAAKAIQVGLAGNQSDVLRELGVVILETTVKEYALAHGIKKGTGDLTEQQKVMARAGLIMQGLKDSAGDLERTQYSASNQFRKAGGNIQNLAISIGQMLLPAVTAMTIGFNNMLSALIATFESNKEIVSEWVDSATDAIRYFSDYWQIAILATAQPIATFITYLETIPTNLGIIADYIANNWSRIIFETLNALSIKMFAFGADIANLAAQTASFLAGRGFNFEPSPMHDLVPELPKLNLPELVKPNAVDLTGDMANIFAGIEEKKAERERAMAAAGAVKAIGDETAVKTVGRAEIKGAAAVLQGSSEASSALAKFFNKSVGETAAKETAANTAALLEVEKGNGEKLDDIAASLNLGGEGGLATASL